MGLNPHLRQLIFLSLAGLGVRLGLGLGPGGGRNERRATIAA